VEAETTSRRRVRAATLVLGFSMMVMGACGIMYEYTLGVLGNNLIGSSQEQIFVIIGIMMFAMGLGAALQRRIGGNLVDKFLGIELLLALVGGVSALVIYATFVWTASYQIALYGFALLIGGLIGLEIPVLIRINTEYSRDLRTNLSEILAMDYVGALVGALIFTYVILSRVSMGRAGFVLGLTNGLVALGGLLFFWRLAKRRRLLLGSCLAVCTIMIVGIVKADPWMAKLEQRCYSDPIIHSETTRYQHVVLTRRDHELRLYINGHLQFSSKDEAIYHDFLVHVPMAARPGARDVLILGGGDGLALREVLRYPSVRKVTLVDLDPAIVRIASTQPDLIRLNRGAFHDARVSTASAQGVTAGERIDVTRQTKLAELLFDRREYKAAEVCVVTLDADVFLRDVSGEYDVAILDFPDPHTLELAKLFSRDFYRTLRRRLRAGGVLSVQATSPYHAPEAYLCIGMTLQSAGFTALPYHHSVPSFGPWGWYLAWTGGTDSRSMLARFARKPDLLVEAPYVTPDLIAGAFSFGKSWLKPRFEIRVNTKLNPVLDKYYQRGWD